MRLKPPPAAEAGALARGFSLWAPEGPDVGVFDLEAPTLAVDSDAAVATEGRLLLGCCEGGLATAAFSWLSSELGRHPHHVVPAAAPQGEGGPIGIDQAGTFVLVEGAAVVGQHHHRGGKQLLGPLLAAGIAREPCEERLLEALPVGGEEL